MKKLFTVLLFSILIFTLSACGAKNEPAALADPPVTYEVAGVDRDEAARLFEIGELVASIAQFDSYEVVVDKRGYTVKFDKPADLQQVIKIAPGDSQEHGNYVEPKPDATGVINSGIMLSSDKRLQLEDMITVRLAPLDMIVVPPEGKEGREVIMQATVNRLAEATDFALDGATYDKYSAAAGDGSISVAQYAELLKIRELIEIPK
ncbi:MAG: hypothetical protein LBG75_03330 [Candidatus Nomurabacteria bacterium]|jgi:hypothetical protein|nr:hypothetical protein [Candidatus Nomurabacteria bacterium]